MHTGFCAGWGAGVVEDLASACPARGRRDQSDLNARNSCGCRVADATPQPPSHPLRRPAQAQNTELDVECEVSLLAENQIKKDPARMQDVGLVKVVKGAGPNQVKRL